MRRFPFAVSLITLIGFLLALGPAHMLRPAQADGHIPAPHVANELIVKLRPGLAAAEQQTLAADMDATVIKRVRRLGLEVWRLGHLTATEALQRLPRDGRVLYMEPNYIIQLNTTPNDPGFGNLWGLHNTGQTGGTVDADIDAPEAWALGTGEPIIIGVIDTGIDYTHEDLAANMWTNPGEIPGNGVDDDNNGYVDDVYGYDFVNGDGDPMDDQFHGTHVAGTIAAVADNGKGVVGVSWNAKLMALKFLDNNGRGTIFDAIRALDYATQMGAKITNNSWGGGGESQALYDAIAAAQATDHLFIAAAGNETNNNDTNPTYPASYPLDNIITVAATNHNDRLSSFSNYGAASVDLAAPGSNILSTTPGNHYGSLGGTSMATPHVAGAAALLWSLSPSYTYSDVRAALLNSVDVKTALIGFVATNGRLNLHRALLSLAPDFTLSAAPAAIQVCAPNDAIYSVHLGQTANFDETVTLSAVGLPPGSTATFTPNLAAPPAAITLTITTSDMTTGEFDIDIVSLAPTRTHTTTVGLTLFNAAPPPALLNSPPNGATAVPNRPILTWQPAAQASRYEVEIATDAAFNTIIYRQNVLGTVHPLSVSLTADTTYYWRVRPSNACGTASASQLAQFTTRPTPPILLVDDDDNGPNSAATFTTALDELGYAYDVWDVLGSGREPTTSTLAPYAIIIWFSGDAYGGKAGPNTGSEEALAAYLDMDDGRCLFLTSQDYLFDQGLNDWGRTYLGIETFDGEVQHETATGVGEDFGNFGPYTLAYPFDNWSDQVVPNASAEIILNGEFGPMGIAQKSEGHRTVFWAFPLEALPTSEARLSLLQAVVSLCQGDNAMGTLEGVVRDATTEEVLGGALLTAVASDGSKRTATTNEAGFYRIKLPATSYTITAAAELANPIMVPNLAVAAAKTVTLNFNLPSARLALNTTAINQAVNLGETLTHTLILSNTGTAPLNFSFRQRQTAATPRPFAPPSDGFGYTYSDSASYQFIDISTTASAVPLTDDNWAGPFPIGFDFNFYGKSENSFFISSNGFISFGAGSIEPNNSCPITSPPPNTNLNLIALMWDDLDPSSGGRIYYQSFDACPYGNTGSCLVVQYTNIQHYPGGEKGHLAGSFQALLFEDGDVLIQIADAGSERGAGATTGLKSGRTADGLGYATCNSPNSLRHKSAICYSYPHSEGTGACGVTEAAWLLPVPSSGSVPSGAALPIRIVLDATAVHALGSYLGELRLESNSITPQTPVPVTMNVACCTSKFTTSVSPQAGGLPATEAVYTVTFHNQGAGNNEFYLTAAGPWATSLEPAHTVTLAPDERDTLLLKIAIPPDAAAGSQMQTALTFTSPRDGSAETISVTTIVHYGLYLPGIIYH